MSRVFIGSLQVCSPPLALQCELTIQPFLALLLDMLGFREPCGSQAPICTRHVLGGAQLRLHTITSKAFVESNRVIQQRIIGTSKQKNRRKLFQCAVRSKERGRQGIVLVEAIWQVSI